jgi:hypothetical protein
MAREFYRPADPLTDARIRETLALGVPPEPVPLPVAKPKPMELLQRWKIAAAASRGKSRPVPGEEPLELNWAHRHRKFSEGWENN